MRKVTIHGKDAIEMKMKKISEAFELYEDNISDLTGYQEITKLGDRTICLSAVNIQTVEVIHTSPLQCVISLNNKRKCKYTQIGGKTLNVASG